MRTFHRRLWRLLPRHPALRAAAPRCAFPLPASLHYRYRRAHRIHTAHTERRCGGRHLARHGGTDAATSLHLILSAISTTIFCHPQRATLCHRFSLAITLPPLRVPAPPLARSTTVLANNDMLIAAASTLLHTGRAWRLQKGCLHSSLRTGPTPFLPILPEMPLLSPSYLCATYGPVYGLPLNSDMVYAVNNQRFIFSRSVAPFLRSRIPHLTCLRP